MGRKIRRASRFRRSEARPKSGQNPIKRSNSCFYQRPQQDSNLRTRLRRPLLYPLSYGGWRISRSSAFLLAGQEYQERVSPDTNPICTHDRAGAGSLAP
jgi:hypothetical protein